MKKYLKSRLPSPESILGQKWLGPLAPWLAHPRLWHLHRRAVALGVAIGLVTGLIPGPVQMLLAVLIAIPLRANIPAAVFATFYTNPLTFVPLYILAYHIGALVTGETGNPSVPPEIDFTWSSVVNAFPDLLRWFVSLGDTLLIGLAIQSSLFALSGYVATSLVWRVAVGRLWRNRHARRG
ncbi:MAG TPA: DUF2062 domain-containing protein [Usitatibacteraceae bacterium]|nr:DUF2062 domain-containing protein [Usitatibacteraceae bacterium]